MFKVNKSLWITTLVFIGIELILFILLKYIINDVPAGRITFICFIVVPLLLMIGQWIWLKIRRGSIKGKKIKALTDRDIELIRHYIDQPVDKIGHEDLGKVWNRNALVYYLAYAISLAISAILLTIIELA